MVALLPYYKIYARYNAIAS